jgi:hypothetical protein
VRLDGDGQREAGVVVVEHTVGKVLLSLSQEKGHAGSEAAERVHRKGAPPALRQFGASSCKDGDRPLVGGSAGRYRSRSGS